MCLSILLYGTYALVDLLLGLVCFDQKNDEYDIYQASKKNTMQRYGLSPCCKHDVQLLAWTALRTIRLPQQPGLLRALDAAVIVFYYFQRIFLLKLRRVKVRYCTMLLVMLLVMHHCPLSL